MRKGDISRYIYWSNRRIRSIARDNGIALNKSWRLSTVTSPESIAGIPVPQAEFAPTGPSEQDRRAMAKRIRKALEKHTAKTFNSPSPAQFANGVSQVAFARFDSLPGVRPAVMLHTRSRGSIGQRVDVCLFGSLDNMEGFQAAEVSQGWYDSSWFAIAERLQDSNPRDAFRDDPKALAVTALGLALVHCRGRRSLGHELTCEWFAEVYVDVVLDEGHEELEQRILIGAPLWLRTVSPAFISGQ